VRFRSVVLLALGFTFVVSIVSAVLLTTYQITATGTITYPPLPPNIQITVYTNSPCVTALTQIDWGTLTPGDVAIYPAYVRNEGDVSVTLNVTAQNWNPPEAEQYLVLTWNYTGTVIQVDDGVPVEFQLTVFSNVTGITGFGFDIVVNATEAGYSKDKVFIQRRPLKSNPHNRMEKNLRNIKSAASRKKKVSWKQRLRVNPSNAEIDILIGLEERGLTKGMFRDMEICLEKTIPDYFWPSRGLAVYLDGPVHLKERQRLKDERIDERLRKLGLRVLRISYRSPLSKHLREKILDEIEEALAGE